MHYEGNIIRPPSEANSILLQVTVGCSRNKCTFCGTYAGERFRIKPDEIIFEDIAFAEKYCRRQRRVFLCDGDALIIPQKRLLRILNEIERRLPWVTRVGVYANAKSLQMKTSEELAELKSHGLGIAYMGLETGDDETLKKINKGSTAARMIEMGRKAKAAGIKLSITVLLGIAGRERSQIHARETGRVLSEIDPGVRVIVVDLHAEATSEKLAMAYYLDGRVSVLAGSHTHVPTADERIFPGGMAYQTDVGMAGPFNSVIGVRPEQVIERFVKGVNVRFQVGGDTPVIQGWRADIDENTGKARNVERIHEPVTEGGGI